jgi:hypothetical protein
VPCRNRGVCQSSVDSSLFATSVRNDAATTGTAIPQQLAAERQAEIHSIEVSYKT